MEEEQERWLGGEISGWQDSLATLDGLACWYPQTIYTVLQKYLQQE